MKTKITKILAMGVLIIMLFSLAGCGSSHGIPKGVYHFYVSGTIMDSGIENAWKVNKDEAERLNIKYKIIEEDGKIYFYNEDESQKFEVKYEKSTKLLFVYMSLENELMPTQFKKPTLLNPATKVS